MEIGKKIKELRTLKGLTQEELADRAELSKGFISQLERDLISQRTKEGLASAKARGRNGGRPSKQNEKADVVMTLYNGGMKIADIVRNTDLSRSTVNRIIANSNVK